MPDTDDRWSNADAEIKAFSDSQAAKGSQQFNPDTFLGRSSGTAAAPSASGAGFDPDKFLASGGPSGSNEGQSWGEVPLSFLRGLSELPAGLDELAHIAPHLIGKGTIPYKGPEIALRKFEEGPPNPGWLARGARLSSYLVPGLGVARGLGIAGRVLPRLGHLAETVARKGGPVATGALMGAAEPTQDQKLESHIGGGVLGGIGGGVVGALGKTPVAKFVKDEIQDAIHSVNSKLSPTIKAFHGQVANALSTFKGKLSAEGQKTWDNIAASVEGELGTVAKPKNPNTYGGKRYADHMEELDNWHEALTEEASKARTPLERHENQMMADQVGKITKIIEDNATRGNAGAKTARDAARQNRKNYLKQEYGKEAHTSTGSVYNFHPYHVFHAAHNPTLAAGLLAHLAATSKKGGEAINKVRGKIAANPKVPAIAGAVAARTAQGQAALSTPAMAGEPKDTKTITIRSPKGEVLSTGSDPIDEGGND